MATKNAIKLNGKQGKKRHPDYNGGDEADQIFDLVNDDPTDEECEVIFNFDIPFAEKLAKVKALRRQAVRT